jgi:hypothetical protein
MTSLGTCRLVMPLSESTMASAGRVAYTALMSASISARLSAASVWIFLKRSPSPMFGLTPACFSAAACFSKTSL